VRWAVRALLLAAAVVALAACGPEPIQRQPVSSDDGLHLSGRLGGDQVHVSVGEPEVVLGTCTPERPDARELCIAARTLAGELFGLVVINSEHLVAGETLPVRASCPPEGCAAVALVEIRRGTDRIQVDGGELRVSADGPRYAARFTLRVGTGTMTGAFDVMPGRTGW
jgi:hypothetical protein